MTEVKQIYAFLADGEDSICGMKLGNTWYAMACTGRTPETLDAMKRSAVQISKVTGQTLRLYKFTAAEELEVFRPLMNDGGW